MSALDRQLTLSGSLLPKSVERLNPQSKESTRQDYNKFLSIKVHLSCRWISVHVVKTWSISWWWVMWKPQTRAGLAQSMTGYLKAYSSSAARWSVLASYVFAWPGQVSTDVYVWTGDRRHRAEEWSPVSPVCSSSDGYRKTTQLQTLSAVCFCCRTRQCPVGRERTRRPAATTTRRSLG